MLKMSIEPHRHALNGATMGTRWSALFYADVDSAPIQTAPIQTALQAALQAAVEAVDAQMSTWRPDSALMRLNAAPVGEWTAIPAHLLKVISMGLDIGHASGGAFDICMGDAVTAWGFGPAEADAAQIRAQMSLARATASAALEVDRAGASVRKHAPVVLDLNGIAKGYGVDCLAETLASFGIADALVGIDGEMRAMGLRPDGTPFSIAVEAPDPDQRAPHSVLALQDAAVATSGDYRHWVEVQGKDGGLRLSHTMDPRRGAPLLTSPASVTVVARTCAEADAWATALMVLGAEAGADMARKQGLDALFLLREQTGGVRAVPVGSLFSGNGSAATGQRRVRPWQCSA
jgi:thiamine biosynthesis lipoprotein